MIHPDVSLQIFRVTKTPFTKLTSKVLEIFMNCSDVVAQLTFAVKEQLTDLTLVALGSLVHLSNVIHQEDFADKEPFTACALVVLIVIMNSFDVKSQIFFSSIRSFTTVALKFVFVVGCFDVVTQLNLMFECLLAWRAMVALVFFVDRSCVSVQLYFGAKELAADRTLVLFDVLMNYLDMTLQLCSSPKGLLTNWAWKFSQFLMNNLDVLA